MQAVLNVFEYSFAVLGSSTKTVNGIASVWLLFISSSSALFFFCIFGLVLDVCSCLILSATKFMTLAQQNVFLSFLFFFFFSSPHFEYFGFSLFVQMLAHLRFFLFKFQYDLLQTAHSHQNLKWNKYFLNWFCRLRRWTEHEHIKCFRINQRKTEW